MNSSNSFPQLQKGLSIWRMIIKSFILLLIINFSFPFLHSSNIGRISLYNQIFPGRERLPFGEDTEHSYNISILNLDALFSSHIIEGAEKTPKEFRVIILGDSSVWGILLHPNETLAGILNESQIPHCGLNIKAFNIGYPTISITKDLLLLDYAMKYQPDLIIWPVTLEAFPLDKQLSSPVVANNTKWVQELIAKYNLPLNPSNPTLIQTSFWGETLLGRRRSLADLFRLQMYGFMWAATGIDQVYPESYPKAQVDLEADASFHDFQNNILDENQLAIKELEAGIEAAGNVPVFIFNEPILISEGKNSDIRYNFYYPRWAYDQYRKLMIEKSIQEGWIYQDLWDLVPANLFTNSAIHLNSDGEILFANSITEKIAELPCK